MSPHKVRVTSAQLRLANNATSTAIRTQKRVFRNCMVAHLGQPRVEGQHRGVRRASESPCRKSVKRSVESHVPPVHKDFGWEKDSLAKSAKAWARRVRAVDGRVAAGN